MPKSKGGVCYPVLQDEHIQWLMEKLDANPDMIVESLHHQLNEAFQFPCPTSTSCLSKAIRNQARYIPKLMRNEPKNYNKEERLSERVKRCQKFLEFGGSVVDVVYINEAHFNLYLTHCFGRAHEG